MGQAKRRKQNNPDYGKVFDLSSTAAKLQHSELVVKEMFTTFNTEFKTLVSSKTFPDNYQSICNRITVWFEQKVLKYQPRDRQYIAQFVIGLAAEVGDEFVHDRPFNKKVGASPAMFCCIFQVTRSFLSDEAVNNLKLTLQEAIKSLNKDDSARLFAESLLN